MQGRFSIATPLPWHAVGPDVANHLRGSDRGISHDCSALEKGYWGRTRHMFMGLACRVAIVQTVPCIPQCLLLVCSPAGEEDSEGPRAVLQGAQREVHVDLSFGP